jgi:transcriptional regulator with XRE-family HTH domain
LGICENVQFLCRKKNLPISHLEKEVSLANGSIRRWNESSPSIEKIQKVADYFEVSVDFLSTGFDRKIIDTIKSLVKYDESRQPYFPTDVYNNLTRVFSSFKEVYYDVPFLIDPSDMIIMIKEPLSGEFKEAFLACLNRSKIEIYKPNILSPKDIASDLENMLGSFGNNVSLSFNGELLDDESKELMRISLDSSMRLGKQLAKKKFTREKYK